MVRANWLEDCDRERKEVPVSRKHVAYDLLLPKGLLYFVNTIFGRDLLFSVQLSGGCNFVYFNQLYYSLTCLNLFF